MCVKGVYSETSYTIICPKSCLESQFATSYDGYQMCVDQRELYLMPVTRNLFFLSMKKQE